MYVPAPYFISNRERTVAMIHSPCRGHGANVVVTPATLGLHARRHPYACTPHHDIPVVASYVRRKNGLRKERGGQVFSSYFCLSLRRGKREFVM